MFPSLQADPATRVCVEAYCAGAYRRCVRFQYTENDQVKPPSDLLPNGRRRTYVARAEPAETLVSESS